MAHVFIWASIDDDPQILIGKHEIPGGTENPVQEFIAALRRTADQMEMHEEFERIVQAAGGDAPDGGA